MRHLTISIALALAAGVIIQPAERSLAQMNHALETAPQPSPSHPYAGMWVTADGHIRHTLLPSGRYDEARGNRESAYRGRYEVKGDEIFYWDDTGFTADGRFIDGVLHHAGMILYRRD